MKNQLVVLVILFLLQTNETNAQGTTFISNIGLPSTGSMAVGSNSWLGLRFFTGTNSGGYLFQSIQLSVSGATGNPHDFAVAVRDYENRLPGASLQPLTGPDPFGGGVFTYTSSGFNLSPSTAYFIVVSSSTSTAVGAFNVNVAANSDYVAPDGWQLGPYSVVSGNGSLWQPGGSLFQLALDATSVPEPAPLTLFGFAGLLFGANFWYRRIFSSE